MIYFQLSVPLSPCLSGSAYFRQSTSISRIFISRIFISRILTERPPKSTQKRTNARREHKQKINFQRERNLKMSSWKVFLGALLLFALQFAVFSSATAVAPPACTNGSDILFVIDTQVRENEEVKYLHVMNLVRDLTQRLDHKHHKFAIITVDIMSKHYLYFATEENRKSMTTRPTYLRSHAIDDEKYLNFTNAFDEANKLIFTQWGGDRALHPNILIFITDELIPRDMLAEADKLMNRHVNIVPVGIGPRPKKRSLEKIATESHMIVQISYAQMMNDYEILPMKKSYTMMRFTKEIIDKACNNPFQR